MSALLCRSDVNVAVGVMANGSTCCGRARNVGSGLSPRPGRGLAVRTVAAPRRPGRLPAHRRAPNGDLSAVRASGDHPDHDRGPDRPTADRPRARHPRRRGHRRRGRQLREPAGPRLVRELARRSPRADRDQRSTASRPRGGAHRRAKGTGLAARPSGLPGRGRVRQAGGSRTIGVFLLHPDDPRA